MLRRFGALAFSVGLLACSAGADDGGSQPSGVGGGSSSGEGGSGDGGGFTSTGGFGFGGAGGDGAGVPTVDEVYGQSPDVLYRLDPLTKAVTTVGSFVNCGGNIIDIALDADSNMYGTTSSRLVRIDRNTAQCTLIATGSYPNSLSFVPAGTLDPSAEALVGYNGGTYIRIDTNSGAITNIGSIGGGYSSSGDIVSVKNGGTYLTVTGNGCGDCLIEVNPATGALVKNWGAIGHSQVFGLAFWGGRAYGFSNAGALFEVTFQANAVTSTVITMPNAPANLQFWGAGSSTSAPLVVPQ